MHVCGPGRGSQALACTGDPELLQRRAPRRCRAHPAEAAGLHPRTEQEVATQIGDLGRWCLKLPLGMRATPAAWRTGDTAAYQAQPGELRSAGGGQMPCPWACDGAGGEAACREAGWCSDIGLFPGLSSELEEGWEPGLLGALPSFTTGPCFAWDLHWLL